MVRKLAGNMVVRGYGCTVPHVKQTGWLCGRLGGCGQCMLMGVSQCPFTRF